MAAHRNGGKQLLDNFSRCFAEEEAHEKAAHDYHDIRVSQNSSFVLGQSASSAHAPARLQQVQSSVRLACLSFCLLPTPIAGRGLKPNAHLSWSRRVFQKRAIAISARLNLHRIMEGGGFDEPPSDGVPCSSLLPLPKQTAC